MVKTSKSSKSSKPSARNRFTHAKKDGKTNAKIGGRRIIRLPYVKKIGQRRTISIWQVDGSYVRTHIDEEFTNYGQHFSYRYIPKEEFWLDQGIGEEEVKFFIKHLSVERRLMKRGADADTAPKKADQVEDKERKRAGDVRKLTRRGRVLPDPVQVHRRLWKKLENGVSIWIVKARLVWTSC